MPAEKPTGLGLVTGGPVRELFLASWVVGGTLSVVLWVELVRGGGGGGFLVPVDDPGVVLGGGQGGAAPKLFLLAGEVPPVPADPAEGWICVVGRGVGFGLEEGRWDWGLTLAVWG